MLGFKSGELTSANWVERVHPHDRPRYRDATIAYFKGHVRHFFCEYRIRNKSDEWCWVSDRATSIRDSDGRVLRLIGAIADISEMPTISIGLGRFRSQVPAPGPERGCPDAIGFDNRLESQPSQPLNLPGRALRESITCG
jgi:hypothetical protein